MVNSSNKFRSYLYKPINFSFICPYEIWFLGVVSSIYSLISITHINMNTFGVSGVHTDNNKIKLELRVYIFLPTKLYTNK